MDEEIAEWIYIADEDLRSAELLNKAYRPNNAIIYYHCAQAIEKYLKGYLIFNNETFKFNHDLLELIKKCEKYDFSFNKLAKDCNTISIMAKNTRYPLRTEVSKNDVFYAFEITEKINNLLPIQDLRNNISKKYGENWQENLFNKQPQE